MPLQVSTGIMHLMFCSRQCTRISASCMSSFLIEIAYLPAFLFIKSFES